MVSIGPYELPGRVFLAPMAGVTDRVFRDLCIEQGAAYAVSEMISSDSSLFASHKTRHRVERGSHALPHAVQIAGSDPVALAEAAVFNVRLGADIIDINMGCPAKKVCNRLAGSALLSDPQLVARILAHVVAAVEVPVTLKIRTGPDPSSRNGVAIARIAEAEGIACLAVHGRTRAEKFRGEAEFETIAEIVDAIDIPVVANGDIDSTAKARNVLDRTGAAAIMVGRAAQGNPWLFTELAAALGETECAMPPTPPSSEQVGTTLLRHVRGCHDLYGDYRGVRIARKHIAWYCNGLRNATALRREVNVAATTDAQLALIERFFTAPELFVEAA